MLQRSIAQLHPALIFDALVTMVSAALVPTQGDANYVCAHDHCAECDFRMKIFVSSTRVDSDWTQQLCALLSDRGFRPMLDGRDVGSAEVWRPRITAALSEADAVVFVLTDSSAEAIECEWEIIEAQRLGRRVIPVLPEPLEGRPPEFLAERSYILFYSDPVAPESGFYSGQKKLEATLRSKRDRVSLRPPRPVPPAPMRDPVMAPYDPAYMPRPLRRRGLPWLRLGALAAVAGFVFFAATNAPFRRTMGTVWAEASSILLAPERREEGPPDGSNVSAHEYTPERPMMAGRSGANVRNYPLPSATILQELPANAPLNINGRIEIQGEWWFRVVLEDGRVGFVHQSVAVNQAAAARPVANVTAIEPAVEARTGRAGANVRTRPGTRAPRIVRLEAGAIVTITGRLQQGEHRWYQLQLETGQTGWARDDVLVSAEGGPLRL